MRKKLLMVGLLFTLIFTLNGCYSDDPQPSSSVAEVPNSSFSESTESINETVKTEPIDNCQDTVSDDTTQEETEYSKDIAETDTTTVSATTDIPKSNDTEKKNEVAKSEPAKTEKVTEITIPESKPNKEVESKKENIKEPVNEVISKEPESSEETFDVDYWIRYAKQYAESIGLELDMTAIECWDNPIAANPKCTNIEQNIISRLNRYKNVEEFTAVWIWAEKVSDNGYELYIGYA